MLRHEHARSGMSMLRHGRAPVWVCSGMGIAPAWLCSGMGLLQHKYMAKWIHGCDSLNTTRETIKIELYKFLEKFWGPKLKIRSIISIEILPIGERNILTKFGEDPLKTVGGVSSRSAKTLKN